MIDGLPTTPHPNAVRALAHFDSLFPLEDPPLKPAPRPTLRSVEPNDFIDRIKAFSDFGSATEVFERDGIPYFVNEYWTSAQRQAHSLHEISYRACFKPQLPAFFIERLTAPGDIVHDPFMGRGTTPLQSALMGRGAAGNDINPLSRLLVRPRLAPPSLSAIVAALGQVPRDTKEPLRDDLLVFFHPETLRQITCLRRWLIDNAPLDDPQPNPAIDWIRMVALNRLTGHSPGFFSVYSMPPNQAVGIEAQRKINEKLGQVPPPRNVAAIILKKTKSLLSDTVAHAAAGARLSAGPADATPGIDDASVQLVVTSPPFLDIVQYASDNWLRCWFAGIDLDAIRISMHRTEAAWTAMVHDVLREQARILQTGGHVAFEVGEVRGGKVLLEHLVWKAADGLPFQRLGVVVNQQDFTKTANCWGVSNNARGTNTNRIVMLRRR